MVAIALQLLFAEKLLIASFLEISQHLFIFLYELMLAAVTLLELIL